MSSPVVSGVLAACWLLTGALWIGCGSAADPTAGLAEQDVKRWVRLEGASNFRDLGGYPTEDGRSVRWGRLFRSDDLSELSDRDVEAVSRPSVYATMFERLAVEENRHLPWRG